ncbi:hypothetical protein [Micromonospora echinofusca]|uniref:hypothetical protein n=1 Tax=Micromonospora echinofusca TaxID=47858 RepID=UPI0033EB30D7
MNIFTVLVAVILYLWLPLAIIAAVIGVTVLLARAAVAPPEGTPLEWLRAARRMIRGRKKRRVLPRLRSGAARLTVEPVPGEPFNDARDVWPMPPDH